MYRRDAVQMYHALVRQLVRGAPYHPQTQGKIERWHHTLKNRILLENYFLPSDLEKQSAAFVEHYNHQRYHESLKTLTPSRCLLWARAVNTRQKRTDQTKDHRETPFALSTTRRVI